MTSPPPPRPEVVSAVYGALTTMDPAPLLALESAGTHVTAAERAAAEDLFLASLLASQDHRQRRLQALQLLIGERQLTGEPTWAELFEGLTGQQAAELAGLYDALPGGARAEYDRRYGPPSGAQP